MNPQSRRVLNLDRALHAQSPSVLLVARRRDPGPTDLPILPNKAAQTPSPLQNA